MKRIDLGQDEKQARKRFGMLHTTAFAGFAPADEAAARLLVKIQQRLDELLENPPAELVLDEQWVEMLKARVFDKTAGFQWSAADATRALDILDVLKAATEWKPEIVKKNEVEETGADLSRLQDQDDAA